MQTQQRPAGACNMPVYCDELGARVLLYAVDSEHGPVLRQYPPCKQTNKSTTHTTAGSRRQLAAASAWLRIRRLTARSGARLERLLGAEDGVEFPRHQHVRADGRRRAPAGGDRPDELHGVSLKERLYTQSTQSAPSTPRWRASEPAVQLGVGWGEGAGIKCCIHSEYSMQVYTAHTQHERFSPAEVPNDRITSQTHRKHLNHYAGELR